VFASLLLALTPGQYVESKEFPRAKQEAALAATAGIVHTETGGEGAAVVVKYDKQRSVVYLLTAAHIVPPGQEGNGVKLEFYSPKTFPKVDRTIEGSVLVRLPTQDIAVIQALMKDPGGVSALKMCPPDQLPKGEQVKLTVLTVGCDGANRTPKLLTDILLRKNVPVKPSGDKVLCWETQLPPEVGRSGGPLIDQKGYLLGICSGSENKRGYYTHVLEIQRALRAAGVGWLVDAELKVPAGQPVGSAKNREKN